MKMNSELYGIFNHSEERHWWFIGRRKVLFSLLDELFREGENTRILEAGCGTGANLKILERYGKAVGVDISSEAVRYALSRGCRDVRLMGETRLPFPDRSFDCVISLDVIEHIEDDAGALNEYARVLRPNGTLFLTVPAYRWIWSCHDEVNRHKRRYTRRILLGRLSRAGFTLERISYFSTFLFPIIAGSRIVIRHIDRLYHLRQKNLDFHVPARPFNFILSSIFSAERRWLKHFNLPFGSSLAAIARRQDGL
jgi:SAM-dependent methyltransferase